MSDLNREYDVIVWGATGFTGRLVAEYLAESFWEVKDEFKFVAPVATLEKSLDLAINSNTSPYIISDMGDNPTAGGAGDVTWTLN